MNVHELMPSDRAARRLLALLSRASATEPTQSVVRPCAAPLAECAICIEPMGDAHEVVLACGHSFHPPCANEWLRRSPTCPLCRR
jgi:Ring finger domain